MTPPNFNPSLSKMAGLCLLSQNGDEWKIVGECPPERLVFCGLSTLACSDFDSHGKVHFRPREVFEV